MEHEYEIFEDKMINNNKLFFVEQNIIEQKELSKINFNEIYQESDIEKEIVLNKRISFYSDDSKKYIIKTKLNKQILDLILTFFNDIEQVL